MQTVCVVQTINSKWKRSKTAAATLMHRCHLSISSLNLQSPLTHWLTLSLSLGSSSLQFPSTPSPHHLLLSDFLTHNINLHRHFFSLSDAHACIPTHAPRSLSHAHACTLSHKHTLLLSFTHSLSHAMLLLHTATHTHQHVFSSSLSLTHTVTLTVRLLTHRVWEFQEAIVHPLKPETGSVYYECTLNLNHSFLMA